MSNHVANAIDPPAASGRIQPLVVLVVAVSAGIIVDRYAGIAASAWLVVAVLLVLCWFLLWLGRFERLSSVVLLAAGAAVGGAWHHCYWNLYPSDELARSAREIQRPICVEVIALQSPRRLPAPREEPLRTIPLGDRSRVTVSVIRVRDGRQWRPASGRAELLVDGHLLGVKAGDRVRVFGLFNRPAITANPGEFDFAWFRRAKRQLIELRTRYPDAVSVASQGPPFTPRRMLGALRDRADALLHRHLDRDQAELAAAVLLGAREQLAYERTEEFFTTGTIHLLAISGLHVGILAFGFWWTTRLFGMRRRTALLAVTVFVIVYALLTDARPPVVRATILVVAVCAARLSGRQRSTANMLAAAALLLLAANPINLFQVGTQLSFLAVATISFFAPFLLKPRSEDPLDRLIAQTRPWPVRVWRRFMRYGGRICIISWLIWLVALPLTTYHFHLVSPIALALNPVAWLPVAGALFFGFGVLLFGWLVPPLGDLFGWLANLCLATLEGTVGYAHRVPGGHFWVAGPAAWWVVVFYSGLAAYAAFPRHRPPRRWCIAALAAWIADGASTPMVKERLAQSSHDVPFACTFLSVGHGACAVVELPGGETLLCDAGCMRSPIAGARSMSAFLWSRGITHVDAVVLSHADADHYNALPDLLERFSVGVVYVSPVMFEEESDALTVLRQAVEEKGVPIREIRGGDRLDVQAATQIQVLHPPRRGIIGGDNANSIVLRIDHTGRTILLPGDLDSPGLDDVLAEEPVDCDVVLAPHHGSSNSNPPGLAAWSTPNWVVVSGGPGDKHPATIAAYTDAGGRVLHTAEEGAVRVVVRDGKLDVRTWRMDPWGD